MWPRRDQNHSASIAHAQASIVAPVGTQTLWDCVDEPILRWVASLGSVMRSATQLHLELREPEPFDAVSGLTSRDVQKSLLRLRSHGLIDGTEARASGNSMWSRLRVTAAGLIALGEWPDLGRVATAASLHRLLRALSEDAPVEDQTALRRVAGSVARTADEVLRGTATDVAGAVGEEAAGG
jgi:hypothetical protein